MYMLAVATLAAVTSAVPAAAATLMVGPDQQYKAPSDAARDAEPGDTIQIAAGTYFDCAVWHTDNLTIVGTGSGAVLTDKTCQGKAIFVVHANDVAIRNITFQRARVPDGNGAGIRAEGVNLTIENSKFINNQEGILTTDSPTSTITIRNSEFVDNGSCPEGTACAHGIYVNHIKLLHIEHSRFFDTHTAHHIKSRAARTELVDNHIEDGPDGTASYEVDIPNGGALVMTGNVLEKGPNNENHTSAIMIGEEGVSQPTDELLFKNNTFTNDGPPTAFVKNITATPARLTGNVLRGHSITPLIGDGTVH
jgi:pectate lyase